MLTLLATNCEVFSIDLFSNSSIRSEFSETLESTEFYSSYQAEWVVRPVDSGTVVQYRLKAEIGGLAPIVANYQLGSKASKMMKRLGRDLSENGLD